MSGLFLFKTSADWPWTKFSSSDIWDYQTNYRNSQLYCVS